MSKYHYLNLSHNPGLPLKLNWKRICLQCRKPQFNSWVRKIPWRRDKLPTPVFLGFPDGSVSKESTCNVGDLDSIPGLGRSPGGGYGNPLQYSCLENPHGQRSLAGYSPWGRKESDMTEWLGRPHERESWGYTRPWKLEREKKRARDLRVVSSLTTDLPLT